MAFRTPGLVVLSVLLVASSAAQISSITDSAGNEFNFSSLGERNGTVTYDGDSSLYGRKTDGMTVYNGSEFELCIEGNQSYRYSARMGASGSFHEENMDVQNKTAGNCFDWTVRPEHVRYDKMRFSFWASDGDSVYRHANRSKSDLYIGLVYENVTVEEAPEEAGGRSFINKFLEIMLGVLNK
ncbi:MAG: hypothetical protein ABEJ03_02525 [Candidatus Nanohaloarchaea archaeon]